MPELQKFCNFPNFHQMDGLCGMSKLSGKARRIHISLPERLLVQIDSFAARQGESRSGLLAHAALEYVAAHDAR
ncbi:MAG: type II toxin-antitoxin system HicB family antitoxin [Verrucomicrobia bacterium]|nr:type II toxin-antitoxin system HicB family antitoxin [Verrucomicrobiota bacterium]